MVAFQMPYSHAISQNSAVSMLMLCNMLENSQVSWYEEHVGVDIVVTNIYKSESICVNDI